MPDPWTRPPPPDTRAVGTGDPAGDMDAVLEELVASGAGLNVQNPVFAGGADPNGAADSAAAFQAAVAAATAVSGEVIIPPGTYKVLSAIPLTGPVRIRGLGAGCGGGPTSAPPPNPAVIINGPAGAAHLFTFPFQGALWGGLEISGIAINYTGTGNVFHLVNVQDALFRDMAIMLTGAGSQAFFTTGSVSVLNVLWERVNITTTAAVRSAPMTSISSSIASAVSNNTWFKCKFSNAGFDNTQYMHVYACTTAGNGFHFADNFRDCWFEHPFGGCLQSLSGQSITIDGCTIWDIFPSLGVSVGHSMFYFGAFSGNSGSQGVRFTGNSRSLNATLLDGTNFWDVECESTTSQVHVEGYTVRPAGSSIQTNVFFNFHGCNDVTLVNNVSPQGSSVNGNSKTVVSNPSPTQVTVYQGKVFANATNGLNVLDPAFAGGADATGAVACDAAVLAAIAAVPAGGGTVVFPAGTFLLNGSAIMAMATANTVLRGAGMAATTIKIGSSFTGAAAFSLDADNCTIQDMMIQGASTTITSNPQCLGVLARARNACIQNLRMFYVNGYCVKVINQTPAGAHQVNHQPHIRNIWMEKAAGGIWLNGDAGDTMGALISDIHGNSLGGGTAANLDALRLEDVFDVDIFNLASSVGSATSGHSIHLVGHCATVRVTGGDIGGFPIPATSSGQCAVKIEDVSTSKSSQIRFMNIAFQTHDLGVVIDGAAFDVRFIGCDITDNNIDGVHLGGTGVDIFFRGCKLANNGTAPPAATNVYDVNWTGTSHGQFSDCVFASNIVAQGTAGGVQFSANTTRNRIQFFPNAQFSGTGTAVANWFPANQFPRYVRAIGAGPDKTPRQPVIAASTVAVTNDTGFDCMVYIVGGTVTVVTVGGNATGLAATPAVVRVPANQTITLTYSAAPTWLWFGE